MLRVLCLKGTHEVSYIGLKWWYDGCQDTWPSYCLPDCSLAFPRSQDPLFSCSHLVWHLLSHWHQPTVVPSLFLALPVVWDTSGSGLSYLTVPCDHDLSVPLETRHLVCQHLQPHTLPTTWPTKPTFSLFGCLHTQVAVSILISDKLDFKAEFIRRDKKSFYPS